MKSISPEEAIAILNDMKIDFPVPKAAVTQRKRNVALDMAISAMSCSEIPNSSDTISRKAAIEAIDNCECDGEDSCGQPWIYKENAVETIEMVEPLPPAQPERIKGHWIDAVIPNDNGGLPVQVCDQCNTFFPLAYTGGGHSFCPHCGADMREVTE